MSKSYNNYLGLLDEEAVLIKKIKRIATSAIPVEDSKNPDECNIYKIYKLFIDEKEDAELRKRYEAGGLSYKVLKDELTEKVLAFTLPIQEKFKKITDGEIETMLAKNAIKANEMANEKRKIVYEKTGL